MTTKTFAFAGLLVTTLVGCGSKQPDPQTQNQGQYGVQGQYGQPGQPQYGQPGQPQYGQPGQPQYGQPGQPQYGQPGQPAPTGQPGQPQYGQPAPTAQPTAQPGTPPPSTGNPLIDQAGAQIVTAALGTRVAAEAPGMKADGQPMSGNVQEGQAVTFDFMAQPGKCYQVLAMGAPPVAQVDIIVQPKNPIPNMPALPPVAQSQTQGPNAASSPAKSCYKYPFPIPAQHTVTVRASKGSGYVGAQLYSK